MAGARDVERTAGTRAGQTRLGHTMRVPATFTAARTARVTTPPMPFAELLILLLNGTQMSGLRSAVGATDRSNNSTLVGMARAIATSRSQVAPPSSSSTTARCCHRFAVLEGIHNILEAAHGDYRYYQFKDGRKIEVVDNYYCYIIPRSSPSSHSLDLVWLRRVYPIFI